MEELKTRWVYCITNYCHWNKPDYSEFEITEAELTEDEARRVEWECRCEVANNFDYDREMCGSCSGTGEVDGEECEECCGTGELDCDVGFTEHVESHTYSWLERYDPAKHFEVPSNLPEHKKYVHKCKVDALTSKQGCLEREITSLQQMLEKAKANLAKVTEELEGMEE